VLLLLRALVWCDANRPKAIMAAHGVPTLDNHGPIVAKCGPVPTASCFNQHGCFCPHCAEDGYQWLSETVISPALRKMLGSQK
jgi:hypothetical protein